MSRQVTAIAVLLGAGLMEGIIRAIDKKVVTAKAAPDVAAKLKELGIAGK